MGIYNLLPGKWMADIPRSERAGKRIRLIGELIRMLGALPAMACVWLGYELVFRGEGLSGWELLNFPVAGLGLTVIAWGNSFVRLSRRHFVKVISSPDELRGRSFTLYLRPFDEDLQLDADLLESQIRGRSLVMSTLRAWWSVGKSEEEHLAAVLARLGPMVTLGIPGEPVPHVGAYRMYLPADDWQQPVRELMLNARLVVLVLGHSAGTMWELVEAMRILSPECLLLMVPMERDEYESFRMVATAELHDRAELVRREEGARWSPPRLPDYTGDQQISSRIQGLIHFSPDWVATFVRLRRWVWLFDWFVASLNVAVAPVLAARRLPPVGGILREGKVHSSSSRKTSLFLSFDHIHDRDLMQLFVALGKNADAPFRIVGWSGQDLSPPGWDAVRQQIRGSDLVVVICGEHTDKATNVATEVSIAHEEETEYILLVGRARHARRCKRPSTASSLDRMYRWTWDSLRALLIGGAR